MKVIIEQDGTKRELIGEFLLLASSDDLIAISLCIKKALEEDEYSYGWITIRNPPKVVPNLKPKGWSE